jgi:hypothetical protein
LSKSIQKRSIFYRFLDPYRWIISYKKPAIQSSTEGELHASFATDGNFEVLYTADPGTNYSATTTQTIPTFQIDLGKSVPVYTIQMNGVSYPGLGTSQTRLRVRVGKFKIILKAGFPFGE